MVEQGKNQRDITIIQLLLNTGLRVSECRYCSPSDHDLEAAVELIGVEA